MTPEDQFTTEEIRIKTNSLRRKHYYKSVFFAAFNFGSALLAIATAGLMLRGREAIWPVWVEAMQVFPGGPMLHWRLLYVFFAVMAVLMLGTAVMNWRDRYPAEGQYVEDALKRLSTE